MSSELQSSVFSKAERVAYGEREEKEYWNLPFPGKASLGSESRGENKCLKGD